MYVVIPLLDYGYEMLQKLIQIAGEERQIFLRKIMVEQKQIPLIICPQGSVCSQLIANRAPILRIFFSYPSNQSKSKSLSNVTGLRSPRSRAFSMFDPPTEHCSTSPYRIDHQTYR